MRLSLIALLLLAACDPTPVKIQRTAADETPGRLAYDHRDLVRYEDAERGVTCYRVLGYGSISCVKTGQ